MLGSVGSGHERSRIAYGVYVVAVVQIPGAVVRFEIKPNFHRIIGRLGRINENRIEIRADVCRSVVHHPAVVSRRSETVPSCSAVKRDLRLYVRSTPAGTIVTKGQMVREFDFRTRFESRRRWEYRSRRPRSGNRIARRIRHYDRLPCGIGRGRTVDFRSVARAFFSGRERAEFRIEMGNVSEKRVPSG